MTDPLEAFDQVALIVGPDGRIVRVNGAWSARGRDRGLEHPADWVGVSYLDLCRNATGRWLEGALEVAAAIDAVLAGANAADVGYACDAPDGTAWYTLAIRALPDGGGALLVHLDAADPRFLTDDERHRTDVGWRRFLGFETRCAWCRRLAAADGAWELREPAAGTRVSDGLCPTCEASVVAGLVDLVGTTG